MSFLENIHAPFLISNTSMSFNDTLMTLVTVQMLMVKMLAAAIDLKDDYKGFAIFLPNGDYFVSSNVHEPI